MEDGGFLPVWAEGILSWWEDGLVLSPLEVLS